MFRPRLAAPARTAVAALAALLASCQQTDLPTEADGALVPAVDVVAPDIVVTSLADDGPGSLRQAVADAVDGDAIGFAPAIAGGTIKLAGVIVIEGKALTVEGPADRGITLDGDGVTAILLVENDGGLILRNATVTGGRSLTGAIESRGTVRIEHSTITGNRAVAGPEDGDGTGGGIQHVAGQLTLVNTTVSGNVAEELAGGIGAPLSSGDIILISSTITGNAAPNAGGLGIFTDAVTLTLRNSLIAGNTAPVSADCNIDDETELVYFGTNLVGGAECLPGPGDIVASDPVLGPLADNGGPTRTHALLPGSPAIEAAVQACAEFPVDQRYVSRPQGTACDIGSFEFDGFITPPLTVDASASVSPSTGAAAVSGSVTCPAPATLTVRAILRQTYKVGKLQVTMEATGDAPVVCNGTRPWSVALLPPSGGFRNGSGTVTARTVNAPSYLQSAEASRSVKLVWGRK
jgi:hypothetical protein